MATILRSHKYINFFSSYHQQTIQSASVLQWALRSNSTDVQINGKNAVIKNVFLEDRFINENIILNRIRNKYFIKYFATYEDMTSLVEKFYNHTASMTKDKFLDTLQDNDILMLIRCCGNMMKYEMPDEKLKLLDSVSQILKSKGFQFNVNHYNALLEVYLENEKDFSPADILSEMINNNVQPNNLTYEHLLTYYCRKGNVSDANKILHYFKENEIPINEKTFSSLIIGNAEANDMNGALNILSTMKVMGCIPSAKAYAAVLYSYAKKGDIENIMETLRTCEEKGIVIDDSKKMEIIYHLSINGHSQHVDKILPLISWESYLNDISHFVPKLIYHKQFDLAFQLVLASSNNPHKPVSQFVLASQFMRNIIKCDLPAEEVIKYLNLMEEMNLPAYESTILNCYIKNQEHYCIPLFKAWQKLDHQIHEHYFWPLLIKHGSQKDKSIIDVMKTMKDDFNIDLSQETLVNFVLPYIGELNVNDLLKILIDNTKLSPENVVNAVIQFNLSRNKLQAVEWCIRLSRGYNIRYNSEKFNRIYQSLKTNESNELLSFIEKNLNLTKSLRGKNILEKVTEVPHVHCLHVGFNLRKYSQEDNIVKAEDSLRSLETFLSPLLSFDKILNYFDLLVKKDRIEDAFQILTDLSKNQVLFTVHEKELEKQCIKSLNLLAEKGSVDGINKLFDVFKDCKIRVTHEMTQPLVKVHLLQNNLEQVLESVQEIEKKYGWPMYEDKIMEAFIKVEDVNSLQTLTNLCTKHSGYINTILNLSIAFLRNNRISQSKQVLMSADVYIKGAALRNIMHKLLSNDEFSLAKDFIQLTKGVRNINRIVLYDVLIEKYSALNNWKDGLELYRQMMNEGTAPSLLFASILSELLKRNSQEVPSSISKILTKSEAAEKSTDYAQILNAFIENHAWPNHDYINILLGKLVKAEDTKSIDLLDRNFYATNQESIDRINVLESCENASQVNSYLEYANSALQAENKRQIRNISHSFNHKTLKYFIKHSENFQLFESIATKMYENNPQLCRPIMTVISFYCHKNPKDTLNVWNRFAPDLTRLIFPHKFFVESFFYAGCFDKFPEIIQSFQNTNRLQKHLFYEALLRVFDDHGKYNRGLEMLLKCELEKVKETVNDEDFDYLESSRSRAAA